jgi:AcrR family transcriptional regulator
VTQARTTFHHGDLRDALLQAGLAMARTGGADAIVLREATRRAGVTPRAAYRHFADHDALLRAVAAAALAEMAVTIGRRQLGATGGVSLLTGVGLGYIQFALDEPGWFDVAFFAMDSGIAGASPGPRSPVGESPAAESPAGKSPYELLEHTLALLVDEGLLDSTRAGDAAIMCWSGVHGFATLTSRGPLREAPRDLVDAQAERLVADLVAAVIGAR